MDPRGVRNFEPSVDCPNPSNPSSGPLRATLGHFGVILGLSWGHGARPSGEIKQVDGALSTISMAAMRLWRRCAVLNVLHWRRVRLRRALAMAVHVRGVARAWHGTCGMHSGCIHICIWLSMMYGFTYVHTFAYGYRYACARVRRLHTHACACTRPRANIHVYIHIPAAFLDQLQRPCHHPQRLQRLQRPCTYRQLDASI